MRVVGRAGTGVRCGGTWGREGFPPSRTRGILKVGPWLKRPAPVEAGLAEPDHRAAELLWAVGEMTGAARRRVRRTSQPDDRPAGRSSLELYLTRKTFFLPPALVHLICIRSLLF